jgi:hypothetical protein
MILICNSQVINDEAQEYLFRLLPFPILQTSWTWVKSLDIDDLNSGAQSLNPILTLAMVELHPSSSQFAPHAKSLKDTGGSWIFCLSMMFNYFFTNCNWVFENVFLRLFLHVRSWNFCSQSGLQLFFLDELLIFFLMKCCWNFCSWSVLDFFFLMICFSNFSLAYLRNIDSWNFSLQNLG